MYALTFAEVKRSNRRHVLLLCLYLSWCLPKRFLEFHCKAVEYWCNKIPIVLSQQIFFAGVFVYKQYHVTVMSLFVVLRSTVLISVNKCNYNAYCVPKPWLFKNSSNLNACVRKSHPTANYKYFIGNFKITVLPAYTTLQQILTPNPIIRPNLNLSD